MTAEMTCPKCGFSQPEAVECARCGVVVSRFHARPVSPPPLPDPAPRSSGGPILPIVGFLAASIAFVVFLKVQSGAPAPRPRRAEAARVRPAASRALASSGWYEGAEGYRRADEERRRGGRAMALYFHTEWCGWCKKMDAEIFEADETRAYLDTIPKVRIDPESGQDEEELARSYGVQGYPTFLIVTDRGARRVHPFTRSGTMTPAEFVAACRAAE